MGGSSSTPKDRRPVDLGKLTGLQPPDFAREEPKFEKRGPTQIHVSYRGRKITIPMELGPSDVDGKPVYFTIKSICMKLPFACEGIGFRYIDSENKNQRGKYNSFEPHYIKYYPDLTIIIVDNRVTGEHKGPEEEEETRFSDNITFQVLPAARFVTIPILHDHPRYVLESELLEGAMNNNELVQKMFDISRRNIKVRQLINQLLSIGGIKVKKAEIKKEGAKTEEAEAEEVGAKTEEQIEAASRIILAEAKTNIYKLSLAKSILVAKIDYSHGIIDQLVRISPRDEINPHTSFAPPLIIIVVPKTWLNAPDSTFTIDDIIPLIHDLPITKELKKHIKNMTLLISCLQTHGLMVECTDILKTPILQIKFNTQAEAEAKAKADAETGTGRSRIRTYSSVSISSQEGGGGINHHQIREAKRLWLGK